MDSTTAKKIGMAAFVALTGMATVGATASAQTVVADEPTTTDGATGDDPTLDGSGAEAQEAQLRPRRRHVSEQAHKAEQQRIRR